MAISSVLTPFGGLIFTLFLLNLITVTYSILHSNISILVFSIFLLLYWRDYAWFSSLDRRWLGGHGLVRCYTFAIGQVSSCFRGGLAELAFINKKNTVIVHWKEEPAPDLWPLLPAHTGS